MFISYDSAGRLVHFYPGLVDGDTEAWRGDWWQLLQGWGWDLNPGIHEAFAAFHHNPLPPLLEFLEAVSIKAPEVMIRGKRNQRQDVEKPVEETIYLT